MRLLVDEGVPVPLLEPVRRTNKRHVFEHVTERGWAGTKDQPFQRAAKNGYDGIVAVDVEQLSDPAEWRALRRSRLHHISLSQGRTVSRAGAAGLARVLASFIVALPYVLAELEDVDGQRIVQIRLLSAAARQVAYDPRTERGRYPYWR